ncbi:MAG: family 16 glycoside hydrolase [Verrucomicrobiota bacterium]
MLRLILGFAAWAAGWHLLAAERPFDFGKFPLNEPPAGFRSAISGQGKPGDWKIIMDEVPPLLPPITPNAPLVTKRPVLAQLDRDATDEHCPLLIFEEETFGDFTLTTRFKTVSGLAEQMAGIAFRIQDENNYYYVRASSLGNTFRFHKLVQGKRSPPIGMEVEIPKGVWHEMTVECKGNQIRCLLNGKEVIPKLTDSPFLMGSSFSTGKIGFWTKSDSVSYFADTQVVYTPRESLAKVLVREMVQKYPRLLGLKIYARRQNQSAIQVIASNNETDIGTPGAKVEQDVIERDALYFGREKQTLIVTLPLHDRNGEVIAAVRVELLGFRGQTEQNAVARALPIVKQMELRVQSTTDLLQ